MLNTIILILIVLWLGGFVLDVVGDAIHVILVIAIAVFALRFFKKTIN
jgi:hypothetical protein